MIFFGVLHFIFVSTFLMKHLSFNYLIILLVLTLSKIANNILKYNISDSYLELSLSGSSFNRSPIDMFQLFEWLPIICLGMICGGFVKETEFNYTISNKLLTSFEYFGKNSLTLYVIHIIPCIYWMSFKYKKN